ncbi:MAG: threonine--tRNA ligase, partial [Gammaproteobacteria bacterium]
MAGLEHSGELAPDDALYRVRHSLAHVLAQAVLEVRPGSTLGFGPPIADGFYYDFILSEPLSEEDFPEIERRMRRILKKRQKFEREDLPREAAMARLDEMGEPYKREYAEELFAKQGIEKLSFYRNGPFLDMCEGPHVDNTRDIPGDAFKLRSIAGAYWRGDSDNVMMTRIYAWAFEDKQALDGYIERWEEAQARDHKKLGRELEIFRIDSLVGRGLPLWLPNGTVIREELEKFAKEMEFQAGYQRVATPHLARVELFEKSGHLPYYAEDMYPRMEVREQHDSEEVREAYVLKPMNCPHHHRIYASQPRSYRDLPLRLAEYGQCYRWEESGAV